MDPASAPVECVSCGTVTPRSEMFGFGRDLRCPTCAENERERMHPTVIRRTPGATRLGSGEPRVTAALIGLIAVVWVGLQLEALRPHLLQLAGLADVPGLPGYFQVFDLQFWHPLMRAIIHVPIWHVALNGLSLWQLGRWIEQGWGGATLALVVLGSATCGTVTAWLVNASAATGISGGIFGLIGWLLALRGHHVVATAIVSRVFLHSIAAMCVMLFVVSEVGGLGISHVGHAAGFVWGFLAGLCARRSNPLPLLLLLAGATVALLVIAPDLEPLGWRGTLFGRG